MSQRTEIVGRGTGRPRAALAAAVMVAAAALAVALLAGASGAGARAGKTTVVLGQSGKIPDPSCPETPCLAIGSVTGFQARTPKSSLPFRVPNNGEITAWSITLSQPTNKQRSFFNNFFGSPPKARLAILKRVPGTQPPRYKLRRQSPVRALSRYLGQTVKFKLGNPLPVRRGNVVALTVPTWAPTFAINLSANNVWRASRQPGRCRKPDDLRQGRPQQVADTRRIYACRYNGFRLLYTATLVQGR